MRFDGPGDVSASTDWISKKKSISLLWKKVQGLGEDSDFKMESSKFYGLIEIYLVRHLKYRDSALLRVFFPVFFN